MISVEEEDHQVAPLITRPAPAAADKLEQIGNVFRLSSETFICCHCLNIALLLLAPALAGAQFILHHIFQFDVNSQFIPARSLVWSGSRAWDTDALCTTHN